MTTRRRCARSRASRRAPPLRVLWITPLRALAADTDEALRAAARRSRHSVDARVAHRRHVAGRARAAAPAAADGADHDAGDPVAAAHARRRRRDLRRPARRRRRRVARADGHQARRAGGARARAAAHARAGAAHVGTLGHDRQPRRRDATRCSASARREPARASCAASSPKQVVDRRAHPAGRSSAFRGPGISARRCCRRWSRRSRKARARSSSPTRARRRRSGIRRFSPRVPTGRARSRCITARSTAKTRDWVENGLRDGALRCVVATSSLDLGVDFSPVDRVLQIGSPKGVARLLQRAGRSGHRPGAVSRVTCVPTNALELLEVAAARDGIEQRRDRGAAAGRAAARRARAARRHRRARRRLRADAAARRGADDARVRRAQR